MQHRVDLLETAERIEEIVPVWRCLAERAGNPFASPEWFRSVHSELDHHSHPAVVSIEAPAGGLLAVFPFVRSSRRPGARLRLAGGERADILGPAAAPADQEEAAGILAGALPGLGLKGPLDLGRVDAQASWWRRLASSGPRARVSVAGPLDPLPYLTLPSEWEEYTASRSRSFRSQLGRKMRSLQRDHEVTITRTSDEAGLDAGLEALFTLHDARWEERAGDSGFGPSTRPFHRSLARATTAAGWTRIYVLEVDGAPAAAWYGWRLGDRTLYYQAGFDPTWERHSVGLLLLAETVKGAIEEGCDRYEMLLGNESFKARFADRITEGRRVTLTRPLGFARLRAEARNHAHRAIRRRGESRAAARRDS